MAVAAHPDDEALFFGGTLRECARNGAAIHVLVLTGAAYCNPPKNAEQKAKEPARIMHRMNALAHVCHDLRASYQCCELMQSHGAPDPLAVTRQAFDDVQAAVDNFNPDLILTHAETGDYDASNPRYATGYDTAREQHQLAHRAAVATGRPVWAYDLNGPIAVPIDLALKLQLLEYYRYGCTQAAEWPGARWYPEFVTETERYCEIAD